MTNAREDSPDWVRLFQAPTHSVTLSSDSESTPVNSPKNNDIPEVLGDSTSEKPLLNEIDEKQSKICNDTTAKSVPRKSPRKKTATKRQKVEGAASKRSITNYYKKISVKEDEEKSKNELGDMETDSHAPNDSVLVLSSDSEPDVAITGHVKDEERTVPECEAKKERSDADFVDDTKESVPKPASKGKSSKKTQSKREDAQVEIKSVKEESELKDEVADTVVADKTSEKHVEHRGASSTLPLVLPENVQRCKALVECEGDSIDLSGDVGAVGRVIISDTPSGDCDMLLDLKGTIYKTSIVPCRTFCVVTVGPTEAKIEAIMNDFIQLKPQSNVYDAETVVEGTLEGFSFDSGDEDDKPKAATDDHQEAGDAEEKQTDGKTAKGKAKPRAGKKAVGTQKKGKTTGPKKRKPQPTKKRKR